MLLTKLTRYETGKVLLNILYREDETVFCIHFVLYHDNANNTCDFFSQKYRQNCLYSTN